MVRRIGFSRREGGDARKYLTTPGKGNPERRKEGAPETYNRGNTKERLNETRMQRACGTLVACAGDQVSQPRLEQPAERSGEFTLHKRQFGVFETERNASIRTAKESFAARMKTQKLDAPAQVEYVRKYFVDEVAEKTSALLEPNWVGCLLIGNGAPICVTSEWLRGHVRSQVVEQSPSVMYYINGGGLTPTPKVAAPAARPRVALV